MKRLLAILLAVLLFAVTFGSCQAKEPAESATAAAAAPTAAPTQTPTAPPAPKPTAAPTQAPTAPPPTEEPDRADPAWFDDAVFIGDSITESLHLTCADNPSLLGKAKFICAQSLGFHNALLPLDAKNAVHPTYEGKTVLTETAGKLTGAAKIFIMLGMNDLGYDAADTIQKAGELTKRILQHSPHVTLYFQSVTPVLFEKETQIFNSDTVSHFNTRLKDFCREKGYHYIDIYRHVCDARGRLNPAYCGDPEDQGIHFNGEGCRAWANALREAIADPSGVNEPDVIVYRVEATQPPVTQPAAEEPSADPDPDPGDEDA